MAETVLSLAEKTFIKHGIQDNIRNDGRSCEDYRHMEVETDVISNAAGSARLRLANSDVLVGIKVEIGEPLISQPDKGRLEFFVDCSANATPEFEGRGGEELAVSISSMLVRAYGNEDCLNLSALCILPRLRCWILYVDTLVLQCGGNLFDVVSLAVKAALFNTRVPILTISSNEQAVPEIEVSDDPYDCHRIDVSGVPCLVTLSKRYNDGKNNPHSNGSWTLESAMHHPIENCHIVDASVEEEQCALARMILGVTENGVITAIRKDGGGSLHSSSISDMMDSGRKVGQMLNKCLMIALVKEEQQDKSYTLSGFLQ